MFQIRYESKAIARAMRMDERRDISESHNDSMSAVTFNFVDFSQARRRARAIVRSGDAIYGEVDIWRYDPDTRIRNMLETVILGHKYATAIAR
jgi:hypothetical protein